MYADMQDGMSWDAAYRFLVQCCTADLSRAEIASQLAIVMHA